MCMRIAQSISHTVFMVGCQCSSFVLISLLIIQRVNVLADLTAIMNDRSSGNSGITDTKGAVASFFII